MRTWNKAASVGIALGVALFVAAGLISIVGAHSSASELKAGPIDPAVVAPAEQLGEAFAMVAAHVRPAVVSVYSEKVVKFQMPEFQFPFGDEFFRQFFGQQFPQVQPQPRQREYRQQLRGVGSGMIIDNQGHVLTNNHVVADMDDIKVRLADKREFEAKVVSSDPMTDVAVIRMANAPEDLPTVTLGDSDAIQVGNLVMAIGAPFGYAQTVTKGIISAKGRSDVELHTNQYEDFLQTDAAINPGNSGGPLVNMRGEVIGMNSAIATDVGVSQFAGVGFAIPINMVKSILPTLLKGEKVTRGVLGVEIREVTPDLAKKLGLSESRGAIVARVFPDSAAAKAGVKVYDVIVSFNGKEVEDPTQLRNMVAVTAPDTEAQLGIIRNGKEETLTVRVGKLTPQSFAGTGTPGEQGAALGKLGLTVETLTPALARQFRLQATEGALITEVQDGSLAAGAGLMPGDLIVEVDRQKVTDADQLQELLEKAKDENSVMLLIKRRAVTLLLVLPMK